MTNFIRRLVVFALLTHVAAAAPEHVVFTYMGDPSTTLTVNWQTRGPAPSEAKVLYDTVARDGAVASYARQADAAVSQIAGLPDRFIYRVQLTGLQPATTYHLVVGSPKDGISQELKVRTIPADDSPLRLVTGGDMGTSFLTRLLLRRAAARAPDFALVGGDIAYANGKLESVGAWDTWLSYYTEEMVTPDGFSIPLVLAIGNHEVRGGFEKTKEEAPFYFAFFGQDPDRSYFTRQFGKNIFLAVLDSGHVASHESQVPWLREQLAVHRGTKHRVALYHVPLYPSHRGFDGKFTKLGREFWGPVFDEFALTVAFENHDHVFKRTPLIKANAVSDAGTLYLGDGCWGKEARRVDFQRPWYLAATGSVEHFWIADFSPDKAVYRAVDADGAVFDVYPETEPDAPAAREVMAGKAHEYFLPRDALKITGYTGVGDTWTGGATTVTLRNPFEQSAQFTVALDDAGKQVVAEGLPADPITLESGASVELALTFSPAGAAAIPREEVRFGLTVAAETRRPGHEKPLRFVGMARVPVRE